MCNIKPLTHSKVASTLLTVHLHVQSLQHNRLLFSRPSVGHQLMQQDIQQPVYNKDATKYVKSNMRQNTPDDADCL